MSTHTERLESLVRRAASRTPDAVAIHDAEGSRSYAWLDFVADEIALALGGQGVRRGDRVGIWLDKSARAIAAMQGVLRLGAAYVPLDPSSPLERIRTIATNADLRAIVTSPPRWTRLCDGWSVGRRPAGLLVAPKGLECRDAIHEAEESSDTSGPAGSAPGEPPPESSSVASDLAMKPPPDEGPDALAYILYTSGSTGTPKGVCISHRNALAFVEWAAEELGAGPDDRFSNHAPFHFDLSVLDLYVAFHAGAAVYVVPEGIAYAPARLVDFIEQHEISVWYSVPSALMLMMDQARLLESSSIRWRAVLFAGEVFPIRPLRELRRRFPEARLLNLYGPTETNVCTFHEVGEIPDSQVDPVPIGRACSGDRVFALREDGRPAEPGEEGELFVTGPTVLLGYFGQEPHGDRPYATGDIVRQAPDGSYVYVARRDHMVKVRGHRIELGEIEAALQASPRIREAAVVVRGEGMRARLRAYVVAGDAAPGLLDCKRLCAARLPRYMIVDEVRPLPELPRTRNGKVDRRRLAEWAHAGEPPRAAPDVPVVEGAA